MNTFSKVNLQNQVVMVNEFDQIEQAEFQHGGIGIDYYLSETCGDIVNIIIQHIIYSQNLHQLMLLVLRVLLGL